MSQPFSLPGSVPFWAGFPAVLTAADGRRPPNLVDDGHLRGLYGDLPGPDCRGVLAWTEGRMAASAEWVADWLGDVLDLRRPDLWEHDLAGLVRDVTGRFFGECPHRPAFLFAESCRDRVPLQRGGVSQRGVASAGSPRALAKPSRRPFRLPVTGMTLPADTRFLVPRGGRPVRGMSVVPSAFERELSDRDGRLVGSFSGWCAADPWDDRADLAEGRTPAGRETDHDGRLNLSRLACWVRMADGRGTRIDTLSLDVHPGTGALVSVRETRYAAQFLLKMHPRWHGWLKTLFPGGG